MPDMPPRWWLPQDYQSLATLDRPAFAWEFLRRNPRYAEDRDPTSDDQAAIVTITHDQAMGAAKWGLSFPGRPWLRRHQSATVLAP